MLRILHSVGVFLGIIGHDGLNFGKNGDAGLKCERLVFRSLSLDINTSKYSKYHQNINIYC